MSEDISIEPTIADPDDPLVGVSVGRYAIIARVAKGGTATVYQALDNVLNREVALKIIHEHLEAKSEVVERFKKEAQLIAQLRHPNILTVYDFIEYKERAVLVVEYMPGFTLSQLIKAIPKIPEIYVLMIGVEILKGLRVAHEKGITHRDIKPPNILLHPELGVKISDFGLAKVIHSEDQLTKTGIFVGTPSFSSPEQIEGKPLDQRTDLFSLGLTLYMMATRSHAFKNQGDSTTTVWFRIVKGKFKGIRERDPTLSKALDRILNKALEVDLSKRYQSADEMLADCEALLKSYDKLSYQDDLRKFLANPGGMSFAFKKIQADHNHFDWKKPLAASALVFLIIVVTFLVFRSPSRDNLPSKDDKEVGQEEAVEAKNDEPLVVTPEERAETRLPQKTQDLLKGAVSVRPGDLWVMMPGDRGPGFGFEWNGEGDFALSHDRNFGDALLKGNFPDRKVTVKELALGNYYFRVNDRIESFQIESFEAYRAKALAARRPLIVSSQFGDVDLELNPWTQTLRLSWQQGPDAKSYRIEIASDHQYRSPLFRGTTMTKTLDLERNWDRNQTIYWRVSYLDESDSIFLVDPSRRISLNIKGKATSPDVLLPRAGQAFDGKIRAVGPSKMAMQCFRASRNSPHGPTVTLKESGSFFTATLSKTSREPWLVCRSASTVFVIPVRE